jgi:hypothetical protein
MDNAPTLLFGAPEGGQKRAGGKALPQNLVHEVSASVFLDPGIHGQCPQHNAVTPERCA